MKIRNDWGVKSLLDRHLWGRMWFSRRWIVNCWLCRRQRAAMKEHRYVPDFFLDCADSLLDLLFARYITLEVVSEPTSAFDLFRRGLHFRRLRVDANHCRLQAAEPESKLATEAVWWSDNLKWPKNAYGFTHWTNNYSRLQHPETKIFSLLEQGSGTVTRGAPCKWEYLCTTSRKRRWETGRIWAAGGSGCSASRCALTSHFRTWLAAAGHGNAGRSQMNIRKLVEAHIPITHCAANQIHFWFKWIFDLNKSKQFDFVTLLASARLTTNELKRFREHLILSDRLCFWDCESRERVCAQFSC